MRIVVTEHAKKRLKDYRQAKIEFEDIQVAAKKIPGQIQTATRFRRFIAKSGRFFDLVIKDTIPGRIVITVIGK